MNRPISEDSFSFRSEGEPSARVGRLVDEYLERRAEGDVIDLASFLAEHDDVADEVREQIELIQRVDSLYGDSEQPALELLGDYRILRQVGRGGMGVVYEAEQISLGRRVALKVLPQAAMLDERQLKRFRNEARAAGQLQHPHIVSVYSVGSEREIHYYAMQFIEGPSLNGVIRDLKARRPGDQSATVVWGRVGSSSDRSGDSSSSSRGSRTGSSAGSTQLAHYRAAAHVGAQAAAAFEYAHSLGVIHRDIKPANLLLDGKGKVWVTDFGLAQFGQDSGLTVTGEIIGTLKYMSPEQALGDRRRVDERSDIYSLGVTLYELATLEAPHESGNRADLIQRILRQEPRRPRSRRPDIPRDLETIILKAIEKDPAHRYPTMRALADDLQAFLDDRPIRARRTLAVERAWRWCRRNRLVASLLVAVLGLTAIVAISSGIVAAFDAERSRADAARLRANVYASLAAARVTRTDLAPGAGEQARMELRSAAESLKQLKLPLSERTDIERQLRDEALATAGRVDAQRVHHENLEEETGDHRVLDVSPALDHVALADSGGRIIVRRLADGDVVSTLDAVSTVGKAYLRFGHDGDRLLALERVSGYEIATLWNWRTGEKLFTADQLLLVNTADLTSDGSRIVALTGPPSCYLSFFDVPGGDTDPQMEVATGGLVLRLHPSEPIAVVVRREGLTFHYLDRKESLEVPVPDRVGNVLDVAWSPDSTQLALASSSGRVYRADPVRGSLEVTTIQHNGMVERVAFHPSGHLLASAGSDGLTQFSTPWSGTTRLRIPIGFETLLRFGVGGGLVGARSDQEYDIWSLSEPPKLWLRGNAPLGKGFAGGVAVSPDGRLLATWAHDSEVRLFSLEDRREIAVIRSSFLHGVAFDPTTGDLIISGGNGAHIWPVREVSEGRLRIGPPREALPVSRWRTASVSRRGERWIGFSEKGAEVADSASGLRRLVTDRPTWQAHAADAGWVVMNQMTKSRLKNRVIVLDPDTKTILLERNVRRGRIVVSPDERWLAISSYQGIAVHDARDFKLPPWRPKVAVVGTGDRVFAFSHDGQLLALAGWGESVTIYSTESRQSLGTLNTGVSGSLRAITWEPNRRFLVAATNDQLIWVWPIEDLAGALANTGLDVPALLRPGPPPPAGHGAKIRAEVMVGFAGHLPKALRDAPTPENRRRLERALEDTPNDPELLHQRAFLAMQDKEYARALETIERAMALRKEDPAYHLLRARAREALGDPAGGLEDRRRFYSLHNWEPTARQTPYLARLLLKLGRTADAIRELERAARREKLTDSGKSLLAELRERLSPRLASFDSVDAFFEELPDETGLPDRRAAFAAVAAPGDRSVLEYFDLCRLSLAGDHVEVARRFESLLESLPTDGAPPPAIYFEALQQTLSGREIATRARAAIELNRWDVDELWDLWVRSAFGTDGLGLEALGSETIPAGGSNRSKRRSSDIALVLERLRTTGRLAIACGMKDPVPSLEHRGWLLDRFFESGYTTGGLRADFDRIPDGALFHQQREFFLPEGGEAGPAYRVPLPAGDYEVTLHFSEVALQAIKESMLPVRVFDVWVEGREILEGYTPPPLRPETKSVRVRLEDGFLDIALRAIKWRPMIAGLEVTRIGR